MKNGIQIKPLHPSLASSVLKVHLDGKDSSQFTMDGNYVNNWACKGSLSADVSNSNNDTTRPTYDASTGRVTFTSANSTFLQSAVFGSALSQPNTVFVVAKFTSHVNNSNIFSGAVANNTNRIYEGAAEFSLYGGAILTSSTRDLNNNTHVGLFNGASSEYWINGILEGSGNAGAFPLDGITLGATEVPGQHSNSEIMEVIVFNSKLPFAENYGIVLGLKDKWSI